MAKKRTGDYINFVKSHIISLSEKTLISARRIRNNLHPSDLLFHPYYADSIMLFA